MELTLVVIKVYNKKDYIYDNSLYCWRFGCSSIYDLQQNFLKRFGNISYGYSRMYMRDRVHKSFDTESFIDAINRSKTYYFDVDIEDYGFALDYPGFV